MVTRSFRKIDDLLSYIGGLFGLITLLFGYLFRYYNQCCFEMEISDEIFKENEEEEEDDDSSESRSEEKSESK